jgi:hypothetical protein
VQFFTVVKYVIARLPNHESRILNTKNRENEISNYTIGVHVISIYSDYGLGDFSIGSGAISD